MSNLQTTENLKTTSVATFGVKVHEAKLNYSVAAFGSMNPITKLVYGNQEWKTRVSSGTDLNPCWEEQHFFEVTDFDSIQVIVTHKPILLSEVEVGRCALQLSEIPHCNGPEWWLLANRGVAVGSIRIEFTIEEERKDQTDHNCTMQTNVSSYHLGDNKDEYAKKLNDLELEREELQYYKRKYKLKMEKLRQEKRHYRNKVHELAKPRHDDSLDTIISLEDFESIRQDLSAESDRMQKQEGQMKQLIEKLKLQSHKLHQAHAELNKRRIGLNRREDCLVAEKSKLKQEREELLKEREELDKMREQIAMEYSKLKQEKQKIALQKKVLESSKKMIYQGSKNLEKQQNALNALRTSVLKSPRDEISYTEEDEDTRLESEWKAIEQVRYTLADKERILRENLQRFEQEREMFEKSKLELIDSLNKRRTSSIEELPCPKRQPTNRTPKTVEKIPRSPLRPLQVNTSSRLIAFS
jgi:hypothetical protein